MIVFKKTILLLVLVSIILACKKETPRSSTKEMLEFTLLEAQNKGFLLTDVNGVIQNSKITLTLPEGADLSEMVATFSFSGKTVLVNKIPQISGVTKNDFSSRLVYHIEAEDGSITSYDIVIEKEPVAGTFFKSFSFNKQSNSTLNQDYTLEKERDGLFTSIKAITRDLKASFDTEAVSVKVTGVEQESGKTSNNFTSPVIYELTSKEGFKAKYIVSVNWEKAIPTISIVTQGNADITSKDDYLDATIKVEGMGFYADYEGETGIRGRGHSTWDKPKRPYRLKLNKKASILGLKEEKDWVLLANHFDHTSMLNPVAMEIGHLLNMPYTNHIIPVDLYLNNKFQGSYNLTEQVEASKSRIDIEDGGQLFEIDSYYDEDYKFYSDAYKLPMQVKYPKLKDLSETDANSELTKIQNAFNTFESLIKSKSFPKTKYLDQFDTEALVNFLIVATLVDNAEINHPKSTYMYKPKNGKYTMGPLWDFDWAFSYDEEIQKHFNSYSHSLLNPNASKVGSVFFLRLLEDPATKSLFKKKWQSFKADKFPKLLQFIDDYSVLIKDSQKRDVDYWNPILAADKGNSWKLRSEDFKGDVNKLKTWIQNRANYMDSYVADW